MAPIANIALLDAMNAVNLVLSEIIIFQLQWPFPIPLIFMQENAIHVPQILLIVKLHFI
jgi:hypothetical protein